MFIGWGEWGRGVQRGCLGIPTPYSSDSWDFHYLSDTNILASTGLRVTIQLAFLCYHEWRGREGKGKGGRERRGRGGRERRIGKRMEKGRERDEEEEGEGERN